MHSPAMLRACCAVGILLLCGVPASADPAIMGQKKSASKPNLLHANAALSRPITVSAPYILGKNLLSRLGKATRRRILAEDNEIDTQAYFVACDKEPAKQLMDALAAFRANRWRKDARNAYILADSLSSEFYRLMPSSEQGKQQLMNGLQVLSELNRMGEAQRGEVVSGTPITPSSLPPSLRKSLYKIVEDSDDHFAKMDPDFVMTSGAAFDSGKIGVTLQRGEFSTTLDISFRNSQQTSSWTIPVPDGIDGLSGNATVDDQTLRKAIENTVRADKDQVYTTAMYEYDWHRNVPPALNAVVTLNKKGATLTEILADLHTRYKIPFLASDAKMFPGRLDVSLSAMPLHQAMDKLMALYPGSHWEYREQGFLIVRSEKQFPGIKVIKKARARAEDAPPAIKKLAGRFIARWNPSLPPAAPDTPVSPDPRKAP